MKSGPILIIRTRFHNNSGFLIGSGKLIGSDFSVKSDSIVFQEERERGGGGHSKAPISLEEGVGKRYKVKEKGIFFNEIKGGTERTGVQRFVTQLSGF